MSDNFAIDELIKYEILEDLRKNIAEKPTELHAVYMDLYNALGDYRIITESIRNNLTYNVITILGHINGDTNIHNKFSMKLDDFEKHSNESISIQQIAHYLSLVKRVHNSVTEFNTAFELNIKKFHNKVAPKIAEILNEVTELTAKYNNVILNPIEIETANSYIQSIIKVIQIQNQHTTDNVDALTKEFLSNSERDAINCEEKLTKILDEMNKEFET